MTHISQTHGAGLPATRTDAADSVVMRIGGEFADALSRVGQLARAVVSQWLGQLDAPMDVSDSIDALIALHACYARTDRPKSGAPGFSAHPIYLSEPSAADDRLAWRAVQGGPQQCEFSWTTTRYRLMRDAFDDLDLMFANHPELRVPTNVLMNACRDGQNIGRVLDTLAENFCLASEGAMSPEAAKWFVQLKFANWGSPVVLTVARLDTPDDWIIGSLDWARLALGIQAVMGRHWDMPFWEVIQHARVPNPPNARVRAIAACAYPGASPDRAVRLLKRDLRPYQMNTPRQG
ncbi:hypothetical protein PTE30175_00955 [Pandoraea terrae]|uniref:Uncharacterized protein n=2 Tax=Pandoraea terrae TaxID=1537710 RepID=A0A5E4STT1_9BURK|nr:hypothetical protein PTE30175_00955 [Pandoraea terrae]